MSQARIARKVQIHTHTNTHVRDHPTHHPRRVSDISELQPQWPGMTLLQRDNGLSGGGGQFTSHGQ